MPSLQTELGKKRPFESSEEEAFLNLVRTHSVLSAGFDALFKEHGLSEAVYNVLRILRGSGQQGRPCGQIGAHLVARVPDVTRLVDRVESMGLAERRRTPGDRRVVVVRITGKGLDLLARLDRPVAALHTRQLGHLKKSELGELSRLLCKARHPEGGPGSTSGPAGRATGRETKPFKENRA